MNKSKQLITIILYTLIIVFASCEIPVVETQSSALPEIVEPTIIIEEEKIIMMKPIEQYPAYAVDESNKVFGLNGNSREVIVLKDTSDLLHQFKDFFVVGGTIYFSVDIPEDGPEEIPDSDPVQFVQIPVTHHYQQSKDTVAEISELPEKPLSEFLTMAEGDFQIIEKDGHSEVVRGTSPTAFVKIDGFFFTPVGLWFSVSETISIRKKGVYFYDNAVNLSSNPQFVGRVWSK